MNHATWQLCVIFDNEKHLYEHRENSRSWVGFTPRRAKQVAQEGVSESEWLELSGGADWEQIDWKQVANDWNEP